MKSKVTVTWNKEEKGWYTSPIGGICKEKTGWWFFPVDEFSTPNGPFKSLKETLKFLEEE